MVAGTPSTSSGLGFSSPGAQGLGNHRNGSALHAEDCSSRMSALSGCLLMRVMIESTVSAMSATSDPLHTPWSKRRVWITCSITHHFPNSHKNEGCSPKNRLNDLGSVGALGG